MRLIGGAELFSHGFNRLSWGEKIQAASVKTKEASLENGLTLSSDAAFDCCSVRVLWNAEHPQAQWWWSAVANVSPLRLALPDGSVVRWMHGRG
jgi:hypothetical protein